MGRTGNVKAEDEMHRRRFKWRQDVLGLRRGPTLPYIGPTSGLREGGPT